MHKELKNLNKPVTNKPINWLFVGLFVYLFICANIVLVISPPCPSLPPSLPQPPCVQAGPVLPSSPILLKRRHKQQ
jgi:hypothetical protein